MKLPPDQPVAQQLSDPLRILDIRLAPGHRFHVVSVPDEQLEGPSKTL